MIIFVYMVLNFFCCVAYTMEDNRIDQRCDLDDLFCMVEAIGISNDKSRKKPMDNEPLLQHDAETHLAKPLLVQWVKEVKNCGVTAEVVQHIRSLFMGLKEISFQLEEKNEGDALKAFKVVIALREDLETTQKKQKLKGLLMDAYKEYLEPVETPFVEAFEKAKVAVIKEHAIENPLSLSTEETEQFLTMAWSRCIPALKNETDMRVKRVAFVAAALEECDPEEWIQKMKR